MSRTVPDLQDSAERHAGRLRVELGLTPRVAHRRAAGLVAPGLGPVELERDRLEQHVGAGQDAAGEPSDAGEVAGRDAQAVLGGEAGHLDLVAVAVGPRRGLKDLEILRADVVLADAERLDATQHVLGRGPVGIHHLLDRVALGLDRHEEAGEIRFQLRLARAGDAEDGRARQGPEDWAPGPGPGRRR